MDCTINTDKLKGRVEHKVFCLFMKIASLQGWVVHKYSNCTDTLAINDFQSGFAGRAVLIKAVILC